MQAKRPEMLSTVTPHDDMSERSAKALDRCQSEIDRNQHDKDRSALLQHSLQALAVTFSGLTAILILWAQLPKPIQALPAALASIITGIVAIFRWQENYIRSAYTAEALRSERAKFEARATPYGLAETDDRVLDRFVTRTEAILMDAAAQWRTAHFQNGNHAQTPASTESTTPDRAGRQT